VRFFASRLQGLPVTDPAGERIGRVRDLVVTPLPGRQPLLTGIIVAVRRRPIFIGAGRIADITSVGIRLSSGRVSLRRFEKRAGEVRVFAELLDRSATERDSTRQVRINDVAISDEAGAWTVVAADIVVGGRLGRSRHETVAWSQLEGLTPAESAASRAALLATARPADLVEALFSMPASERIAVFGALDDELAAVVLEELADEDASRLLGTLGAERIGDVLDAMDADDAADLLGSLPPERRAELLQLMEPDEAAPVRRLLSYAPNTAAGLMTVDDLVILQSRATVAEALARLRDPALTPALASMAYVCEPPVETPTGRFHGVAHIQRLLRARPSDTVSVTLDRDVDPVTPDMSGAAVAAQLTRYRLVALPVCDEGSRLLGVVAADDVFDHLLPKGWRSADDDPEDSTTNGGE
jgi:hypothetical protein